MLLCDNFTHFVPLFPRRSVGGCYVLSPGLEIQKKWSVSPVRTIILTPTGISTNMVLDSLIHVNIRGSIERAEGHNTNGQKVQVFIKVCGFLDDYFASARFLDVMKHSAKAPCTHCSFRHCHEEKGSNFSFRTPVHSGNRSFSRSMNTTIELREKDLRNEHRCSLGVKVRSITNIYDHIK